MDQALHKNRFITGDNFVDTLFKLKLVRPNAWIKFLIKWAYLDQEIFTCPNQEEDDIYEP